MNQLLLNEHVSIEELNEVLAKAKEREKEKGFKYEDALSPVIIENIDEIKEDQIQELVERYYQYGFVIYEVNGDTKGNKSIFNIADAIQLGDPFVPNHYKNNSQMYQSNKLNLITAGNVNNHMAFTGDNNQGLHSDGTVHEIGHLKTTILFCESPAAEGGESILFHTMDAFYELAQAHPEAALAMFHPESLKRKADIGFEATHIGPAFAIEDEEIITRFTLDHTALWEHGFERVPHLHQGYMFLKEKAEPQSEYFRKFTLGGSQGIIMANDKIAHGRLAFKDSEQLKRKMLRGVFRTRPSF
ncbi:TauD/TfdA family dioxygenase [Bacillus thuringiensis]|uniref:TauD/TfdA family dioxygenase n=1 Tax=Bacillus thuringiensis TaxID=1428 RepID=UPI000A3D1173|nr:TauD/TfdA family dioxygenase [Bacillus thuringiensis]OUA56154.1 hypothetical protein BK781_20050 [Bacillus thuringiensis serovar aizawai]